MEALKRSLENPWVEGLLEAGLIMAALVVIVAVSRRLLQPLLNRLVTRVQGLPDEHITDTFLGLVRKILVFAAIGWALSCLPLPTKIELIVHNAVFVIIAIFILLGLFDISNVLSFLVRRRAKEFEVLTNRILKILSATIVLMVTMRHFNYDIWHIVTALGVGTLAVGLAAQPTLANMIAGFTILLDRPFRQGDRISISGGDSGDVIHIGIRSTQILTADGNTLVVANSDLVNSRLLNFSYPNAAMGHKVKFFVDHRSSLVSTKSTLKSLSENVPGVIPNSVNVYATGTNEWGVEVTVFFQIEDFRLTARTADGIIESAITEFRKQGMRLATNPLPPLSAFN